MNAAHTQDFVMERGAVDRATVLQRKDQPELRNNNRTGQIGDDSLRAVKLPTAQNQADWRLFLEAIKAGQIDAGG